MTMRDQTYSGGESRAVGRDAHDERERDLDGMRPLNAGRATGDPVADVGIGSTTTSSTTTAAAPRDRSIADLLKELRDESSNLLRQEVALAKTEMAEKAADYGKNAAAVATGGAVAYAGALLLLAGLTVALALMLHRIGLGVHGWWVAPLVVGGIVAAIGYSMINKGVAAMKRTSPVPEKTVQSLQEDKQWLANKVS
jgi:hypothetical protein